MAFELKKFNDLYESMRSRTTVLTDFEVGSVTRTMYESFAYELGLLYQKMNLVYLSAFVDSAEGTNLDQVVAVLGIQRSLPDFSVGEVVFERDKGNADINIPLGTLVATVDTPDQPKKVYQTIEAAVLAKDQSEITVKVQAVNRGEDQDSDPGSIVVMPRPIAGIKSVNNPQPVILVGRRRETDDELRSRAKNALLSSGKANLAALENAVLSLPSVLDVKVREDFHFAKGIVALTLKSGLTAIDVPKGSTISADDLPYRTLQEVKADEIDKKVQVVSLLEGKQGELPTGKVIKFDSSDLDNTYALSYTDPIVQSQFGMAEVIVDTPDFDAIKEQVVAAIDAVRAAGVLVSVGGAEKVYVDGVFRITTTPQLNLNPDERAAFEEKVRQAIVAFFQSIKMGQPILFSKMMKAVLSVDGVDDLSKFQLSTLVTGSNGNIPQIFLLKDNKIEADELERFYPRNLCVASEDKLLPINITFKASSLNNDKIVEVKNALETYINGIPMDSEGSEIKRTDILEKINTALSPDTATDLKVLPVSWCPDTDIPLDTAESYTPKFVEKPVLGNLFGYKQEVQLSGALMLILPNNIKESDKITIRNNARANITAYLDSLAPEDDVIIDTLLNEVKKDSRVLDTKFSEDDLVVTVMQTPPTVDPNRFKDGKIDIKPFEKAILAPKPLEPPASPPVSDSSVFVIATEITAVKITISNVTIQFIQSSPPTAEATIKTQVAHTLESFLAGYVPGQDLAYIDLKSAILNLSLGVSFTLMELALTADSEAGFDSQLANAVAPKDIVVREVELAVMNPIDINKITITEIKEVG